MLTNYQQPDPSGKQKLYWVEGLKGLAVLVSGVSKAKSYIVQSSVHGKTKRIHLGTVEEFEKQKLLSMKYFQKAQGFFSRKCVMESTLRKCPRPKIKLVADERSRGHYLRKPSNFFKLPDKHF